jgi:2-polyprenyl-3-methyl-5-hydroxy-6-metoxy-1,4-benzoquinol methylase
MCEEFKAEQLFFHRHHHYRLNTLVEAKLRVYDNAEYMGRYINGILLSQFLWANHARSFHLFGAEFLAKNPPQFKHLDIGSGHGLFLAIAAQNQNFSELHAWDISQSSLEATKKALKTMGVEVNLFVKEQDLLDNSGLHNEFDSVICSEVLEHTENPEAGLKHIYQILKPGGRAYINVPINSPAPDHIFLWRKTDEVRDLFSQCGFEIEQFHEFPASGISLERAKKFDFDISCIGILKKPI